MTTPDTKNLYSLSHLTSSEFRFLTSIHIFSPALITHPIVGQPSATMAFFYFAKAAKPRLRPPFWPNLNESCCLVVENHYYKI